MGVNYTSSADDCDSKKIVCTQLGTTYSEKIRISPSNQEIQMQAINEWEKCWDEEVKTHYYYNIYTGEASWCPPSE